MIAILLWVLATVDAMFASYRDAAGRNALIDKRAYYRRAMAQGALYGQMAVLMVGLFIAVIYFFSSDSALWLKQLHEAGFRMLYIYSPYAGIIFLAFLIRLIPSVDIRSITSVLIFGPFTFIRPFVAIAGLVWGIMALPNLALVFLGFLVLALMYFQISIIKWIHKYQMVYSTFE